MRAALMTSLRRLALPVAISAAWASGCYSPSPSPGAFACSTDFGSICPSGLVCSPQGLCVLLSELDMGHAALDLAGDQSIATVPRTCEQLIAQGAFTHLTPLTLANTAADETHLALDPTGTGRLLFQRGNQLFSAAIDASNPKSVLAPLAVTLTGGPTTLNGGSFTSDGKYWFSGTTGSATSLYSSTPTGNTFAVDAPRAPTASTCAFSDPAFVLGDIKRDLLASYALGGCGGKSYIVQGAADRNLGAFYSALVDTGWASPSFTPSGLTLIVASTDGAPHLYAASRSDLSYQFTGTGRINMTGLGGDGMEDRQLVVSQDCRTLYLSSVRAGGMGGADLYAADILPE